MDNMQDALATLCADWLVTPEEGRRALIRDSFLNQQDSEFNVTQLSLEEQRLFLWVLKDSQQTSELRTAASKTMETLDKAGYNFMGCVMPRLRLGTSCQLRSSLATGTFTGSDLRNAKIVNVNLTGTKLINCNLLNTELGHYSLRSFLKVNALKMSPNSQYLALTSDDGQLEVRDARDNIVHLRSVRPGQVHAVAFSYDSDYLLVADETCQIGVYDIASDNQASACIGHTCNITVMSASNNAHLVVSGSQDRTARVWAYLSGTVVHVLPEHPASVSAVDLSHDLTWLASGSTNGIVRLTNLSTKAEYTTSGFGAPIQIQFEADKPIFHANFPNATPRCFAKPQRGDRLTSTTSVFFSGTSRFILGRNERYLVAGSVKSQIDIVDDLARRVVRSFYANSSGIVGLDATHDCNTIVAAYTDGTVIRLEEVIRSNGHTSGVKAIALSDDRQFMLSGSIDKTAILWDIRAGRSKVCFLGHTDMVKSVALSADHRLVLTGSLDKSVRLWDAQTGEALHVFTGHNNTVTTVTFSPSGSFVVSGSLDKSVKIWTIAGSTLEVSERDTGARVSVVRFTSDETRLVVGSWDQPITVWRFPALEKALVFKNSARLVSSMAVSQDDTLLVTGHQHKQANLWRMDTGELLRSFRTTQAVAAVGISNMHSVIVTGELGGIITLWDLEQGTKRKVLNNVYEELTAIDTTPNGHTIVSCSLDNTVHFWRLPQLFKKIEL